MQRKKIIPLAVALALSATVTAGAAQTTTYQPRWRPSVTAAQQQNWLHARLCERFRICVCGRTDTNLPTVTPDTNRPTTKPETDQPVVTPDTDRPTVTPETPESTTPQSGTAAQVLSLVNAERTKAGLKPLTASPTAQKAAQVRAGEIVRSFAHTRPNGSSFSSALTEAGVSYRGAGENIAYGQPTAQAVMQAWMNSPGHRANILNAKYTHLGVGYTVVNGTPYWVQLFTY